MTDSRKSSLTASVMDMRRANKARLIASPYCHGMFTPLYKLVSSGYVNLMTVKEIKAELPSGRDRDFLMQYCFNRLSLGMFNSPFDWSSFYTNNRKWENK